MRYPSWAMVSLLGVLSAVIPGAGSSVQTLTRLVVGISPGDAAGIIYGDLAPGRPTTVGDLFICVDGPGTVSVERIESSGAFGGLVLEDFAVIPWQNPGFADLHQPISAYGIPTPKPMLLHGDCPPMEESSVAGGGSGYWLLLQYSRPSGASAGNSGFTIHYSVGGWKREVYADFEITLCAADDRSTGRCADRVAALSG